MTLPASGAISMQALNTEVGSNQNNFNSTILRALAGKPTPNSAISFSDFYSKSGKFSGNVTTNSSGNSSGGISFQPFMNGSLSEIIKNVSTGNCELHMQASPPIWTGNITVTNNTTGVSTVLSYSNSISWIGPCPANLLRPSANDLFTIIPS